MPILDIQSRFRELGRIRTGMKVRSAKGKLVPTKLPRFRLTSQWRHLLDAAAEVYGGTVAEWDNDGRTEYELIVEKDALDVVVPPGVDVLDQWYERWSGGGLVNRCDGLRQTLVDQKCRCPEDPQDRAEAAAKLKPEACKPTTRLRVMLPAVPDLGIWRLETHGFHAATELAGAAQLVETATRAGAMIPAELRLHERVGARRPGEPKKTFFVPALSFRATLGETLDALGMLQAGSEVPVILGAQPRPALDSGGRPELPPGGTSFDPSPPVEGQSFPGPTPALPAPEEAQEARSAPERPVAAPEAPEEGFAPPEAGSGPGEAPPAVLPAPERYDPPEWEGEPDQGGERSYSGPQLVAIKANALGITERDQKLALVSELTGRTIGSAKDLTVAETQSVLAWLNEATEEAAQEKVVAFYARVAGPEDDAPRSDPVSPPSEAPTPPTTEEEGPEPGPEVLEVEVLDAGDLDEERRAIQEFDGRPFEEEDPDAAFAQPAPTPAVTDDDPFDVTQSGVWDGATWKAYLRDRKVRAGLVAAEARKLAEEMNFEAPTSLDGIAGVDPSGSFGNLLCGFVEDIVEERETST